MAILYSDERFLQHDTGRRHPESAQRLRVLYDQLRQHPQIASKFDGGTVSSADRRHIERVHDAGYLAGLQAFAGRGGGRADPDTVVSPQSFDVALLAAGAAIDAVDQVLSGRHQVAVCLQRPPGHHALRDTAMGFCLINNVAVAARHALAEHGLDRVLIVDWDVHHGNGTQALFEEEEQVCFFSAHRWPFYPGTGAEDETGRGRGQGTIFNLPLEFGISRADYHAAFQNVLGDAASRCRPELVLLSAGFDAHAADPIGSLGLETEDFGELTRLLRDVADQHCDGKIVSLLEGGYNVQALAESVACHLEELAK